MANDQHIQWLLEGVPSWNKRRERDRFTPDLYKVSFLELFRDTSQLDANGRVQLSGANLAGADLTGASLTDTDFNDADFRNASLTMAFSRGSVYTSANFAEADLIGFSAEGDNLSKANFLGAKLGSAGLRGADLSGCDLTDANLCRADLTCCDLSGATLARANLIDAQLNGAKLFGTQPWQAIFYPRNESLNAKQDVTQIPIKRVSDLLNTIANLDGNGPLYFRGEPALDLQLSPSVIREGLAEVEGDMLLDLISRRPQEMSGMATVLDQWVLARHHGLKTRFLDVTKNPLVGLFFACDRSEQYDKDDACLHIFSVPEPLGKTFSSDTISVIANFARLSKSAQDLILTPPEAETTFYQPLSHKMSRYYEAWGRLYQLIGREKSQFEKRVEVKDLYGVFVVEPQQSVERVIAQSGAFLVSAFRDRFDYPEGTDWNGGVSPYGHFTLMIPNGRKEQIRNELAKLNISRETLFPGLDSAAAAITDLHLLRRQTLEP